jgi:hypothetical protein
MSVLMAQQSGFGAINADCARPLAGCANPNDPNSSLTNIGQILSNRSAGGATSHQLQLTVDKRFSRGFNLRGAYTLAKTIDIQSGFRYNTSVFTDPAHQAFDRGAANFDVRHRLAISGLWEIPWDKPFKNGFMKKVTEGWQLNAIAQFQTGTPFTIFSNSGSSGIGTGFDRADRIKPTHKFDPKTTRGFNGPSQASSDCLPGPTIGNFYFDPSAYGCLSVPQFTFGNSGRNSVYGPGRNQFDLSMVKRFKFAESRQLEFRTELFNAFNHTQFFNPDHGGGSSTFGQVTQAREPRIMQLALKFYF